MKGVVLAGGTGSRLGSCTTVTNKHLLPVYDRPMIFYPVKTLTDGGIKEIMIIIGKEHAGDFIELLGDGSRFGAEFTYRVQEKPNGIAGALKLCRNFVGSDNVAVILGDNIFSDKFRNIFEEFRAVSGAMIFLKEVDNPSRFGVPIFKNGSIIKIEEKPKKPKSIFAVTGLYLYDNRVFDIIDKLVPSKRGELEITDVNNFYINHGSLRYGIMYNGDWIDCGTYESLYRAASVAKGL